jgi:hypothetical protein
MPAPDLTGLEHDVRTLGWVLIIDGIEPEWDDRSGTHTAGTNRTAEGGIVSCSPTSSSIDAETRRIRGGDVTVRIAATRENSVADVLGRVTPRGATRSARLAVDVAQTPLLGATVEVSDSIAAWPATGVIWVGQEAMSYNARTVVAPFQFTIPVGGRAYYGSPCQAHTLSGDGAVPTVTSECVSWRGRPAALRVAEVRRQVDGSLVWGDLVDEVRGFLDGSPQRLGDGTYELTIVPWHAKIDVDVFGSKVETRLQPGWHLFDGSNAYRMTLTHQCIRGEIWRVPVAGGVIAGNVLDGIAHATNNAWSDVTLVGGAFDLGRRGPVNLNGVGGTFWATGGGAYVGAGLGLIGVAGVDQMVMDRVIVGFVAGDFAENANAWDKKTVQLGTPGAAFALQWPAGALALINAVAGWAAANPNGVNGSWCNILVQEDAGAGPAAGQPNAAGALTARLTFESGGPVHVMWSPEVRWGDSPDLWYGIDLSEPGDTVSGTITTTGGFAFLQSIDGESVRVAAPYRLFDVTATPNDVDDNRDVIPIRGVASAFWQTGERYILAESDVFPAAPFTLSVRWTEPVGKEFSRSIRIKGKQAANAIVAGCLGTALEVEDDDRYRIPSFGSWMQADAKLSTRVAWWRQSPRTALYDLLTGGTPSSTLPDGAGVPSGYVDLDSFNRYPLPAGRLAEWTHEVVGETSLSDLIRGLLTQIDAILTERLDPETGIRKLVLAPSGIPSASMSEETVADGDWTTDDVIGTWDERLVNVRTYLLRRGMSGGYGTPEVPTLAVTLRDVSSIQQYGEQSGGELELQGVDPASANPDALRATLLPLFASETAERGDVRLLVRGSISAQQALRLFPGAVVGISCADVPGFDASPLSGAVGRVTSVERDNDASVCAVEVMVWPAHGAGIAPAMRITAIPGANSVTVAANYYAPAVNPLTGAAQVDSDLFAVGDQTRLYSMDGTLVSSPTILTIVGATVTFTGAHGLGAAPAYLSGPVAVLATPTLRAYAYLGTDGGLAGGVAVDVYT